ncbi:hypothetical protein LguiA_029992 [Lonicera macranthoides]
MEEAISGILPWHRLYDLFFLGEDIGIPKILGNTPTFIRSFSTDKVYITRFLKANYKLIYSVFDNRIVLPDAKTSSLALYVCECTIEALPFIQKFRGKTIVVKYGGAAMTSESLKASVIADLVLISCLGLRIVFVHGSGPEINLWLGRLGLKPNLLNGLQVTDASTIEIVSMVLVGKVNKQLVSLINKAGATAVGLSGINGRFLSLSIFPQIRPISLQI